jgi:hypothetical protein
MRYESTKPSQYCLVLRLDMRNILLWLLYESIETASIKYHFSKAPCFILTSTTAAPFFPCAQLPSPILTCTNFFLFLPNSKHCTQLKQLCPPSFAYRISGVEQTGQYGHRCPFSGSRHILHWYPPLVLEVGRLDGICSARSWKMVSVRDVDWRQWRNRVAFGVEMRCSASALFMNSWQSLRVLVIWRTSSSLIGFCAEGCFRFRYLGELLVSLASFLRVPPVSWIGTIEVCRYAIWREVGIVSALFFVTSYNFVLALHHGVLGSGDPLRGCKFRIETWLSKDVHLHYLSRLCRQSTQSC